MASKQEQLEQRIAQLEQTLRALGVRTASSASQEPEDRADYMQFGSPEHATFLGLIEVEADAVDGRIAYTSPNTNRTYVLEDEVTPFMTFPDPGQVAALVLRQKVSAFEAGAPKVPDNAPPMWQPVNLR